MDLGRGNFQTSAETPGMRRIVVAVDFSRCAAAALRYGAFLTQLYRSELLVLHVMENQADPVLLDDRHRRLQHLADTMAGGSPVETKVVVGDPAEEVVEHARDADLLVIGRRGLSDLSPIGVVASRIILETRELDLCVMAVTEEVKIPFDPLAGAEVAQDEVSAA
jgi:nucleotide-binding universal stress UspA family protein